MADEISVRFTGIAVIATALSCMQKTLAQTPNLQCPRYGTDQGSEALSDHLQTIAMARLQLSKLAAADSEAVASIGIAFQQADNRMLLVF